MPDAPIDALEVLQAGPETTPGVSVNATSRVHIEPGSVTWDHAYESVVRRYAGSLATSHGTALGLQKPVISYRERVTYDHVVRLLSMSLKGGITGTGAGADKLWTAITPSDVADDLKRYTFEVGGRDAVPEEEEFTGCVASEIEFAWAKSENQPLMANVSLLAMRDVVSPRTPALTVPTTFVEVLTRTTRVYIDPATIGTTSYARAISGSLVIGVGLEQRFGTDGNDYPNSVRVVGPREVRMDLMAEYDTTVLRNARRNETLQKIRLEFPGPTLGATNYNLRFDFFGKITTIPVGSDGGVKVLNLSLSGEYDPTTAAEITATVTNTLTSLP